MWWCPESRHLRGSFPGAGTRSTCSRGTWLVRKRHPPPRTAIGPSRHRCICTAGSYGGAVSYGRGTLVPSEERRKQVHGPPRHRHGPASGSFRDACWERRVGLALGVGSCVLLQSEGGSGLSVSLKWRWGQIYPQRGPRQDLVPYGRVYAPTGHLEVRTACWGLVTLQLWVSPCQYPSLISVFFLGEIRTT